MPRPPNRLASGTLPERTIEDGKFQLTPLMRYDYRVIAPANGATRCSERTGPISSTCPGLRRRMHSAHRRLIDDVFRPMGTLPKRVAFTDQEDAMIEFVESGNCLSLARDCVLDRITRKREFRDRRQGGADLRPQFRLPDVAASRAGDLAGLLGHAGGMGAEPGRRGACTDRSGKIAEKRADRREPGSSRASNEWRGVGRLRHGSVDQFGRSQTLAGSDLPSQIDFSDRHSSDVSSGGRLADRSSRLIRASRSSLRGWLEMMESPCLPCR